MRFNGKELVAVALQPSHKFDKEGILYIKEKQEGLFRRGEAYTPRFCRLRGNMLFYFKSSHQCSEPGGVYILERCSVHLGDINADGNFNFTLKFEGDKNAQHFATALESERDTWIQALHMASYEYMRSQLQTLQEKLLDMKQEDKSPENSTILQAKSFCDSADEPFLEMSLACDNLTCDGDGTPPNPMLTISLITPPECHWQHYMQTEILERCSNPCFLTTIGFRINGNINSTSRIKISAYDVRERLTSTMTLIGSSVFTISQMTEAEKNKLRLTLLSADNTTVGFVSITAWQIEPEVTSTGTIGTSSESSPQDGKNVSRSSSLNLPVKLPSKPRTVQLNQLGLLYEGVVSQTYRFHTGLGADLSVHEIMAENKLIFKFAQSLLALYIKEEKEYLSCLTSFGEVSQEWTKKQVEEIERHLQLINSYTQALTYLDSYEGPNFKASSLKGEPGLEFVPVNLHLQRMWVQNDSTKKSGFYDVITVGAFTAHSLKFKNGGLLRLLSESRLVTENSRTKSNKTKKGSDSLVHAADAAWKIKTLRQDLHDAVDKLNILASHCAIGEMQAIMTDIKNMANEITKLCEPVLMEDACQFLEEIRQTKSNTIRNGCVLQRRNSPLSGSSTNNSPLHRYRTQHANVEKLSQTSLSSSPEEKIDVGKDWPLKRFDHRRSVSDAHLHADIQVETIDVDRHSLINLEVSEENSRKKSVKEPFFSPSFSRKLVRKLQRNHSAKEEIHSSNSSLGATRNTSCSATNFLCKAGSKPRHEHSLVNMSCSENLSDSNKVEDSFKLKKSWKSTSLKSLNGSRLRSKSPEDPEPWDLTQLNIEASIMCMASKVKALCHRTQNIDFGAGKDKGTCVLAENVDAPLPPSTDWVEELRPSTKKLKQALDHLLKTSKITHGLLALQESSESATQKCAIQFRRDIAFSQVLSAAIAGIMTKFWCIRPNSAFISRLKEVGLLLEFEGLLSCYGDEMGMLEDMVVAIGDLINVVFKLQPSQNSDIISPTVEGHRLALVVSIPIPDEMTTFWPSESFKNFCFSVTPVFFNVGINEQATFAMKFGDTSLQDKINIDGAKKLSEFYEKCQEMRLEKEAYQRTSLPTNTKSIDALLDKLSKSVHQPKSKNAEILHIAAEICRLLGGIRFTSCKSAKDRTSMSVTLEQCMVLQDQFDLAEHEFQHALDCMRCEGTRRENTLKNAGVKKYAFNSLQLMALPKLYRPPPGTYGNVQT